MFVNFLIDDIKKTDLKNELESVSNWMRINKLSLNCSKSEYMVIGHRRQLNKIGNDLPDLVLNSEVITRVDTTKYPGIIIDESFNWKEQYKAIKNQLKGGLSSLKRQLHVRTCGTQGSSFGDAWAAQIRLKNLCIKI